MHEYSTKPCRTCGEEFLCSTKYPERNRKYCSRKCANAAAHEAHQARPSINPVIVSEKWCSQCKQVRSAEHFYVDGRRPDGLKPWCKDCRTAHHKERYDPQYEVERRERLKQDPEWVQRELERGRAKMLKQREQREAEAPLPKVCATCGETKTRGDFSLNSGFKDGRLNHCKACNAAKRKREYAENAEERREKANARYASDINVRQRAANQQRRWHLANREKASAIHKAWYESHREEVAQQRRRKYETRQDWLVRQKEGRACYRCGWSDVRCLDWHHIDPETKIFNIGEAAGNNSLTEEEVLFEISKCTCICANCHRIEHWEEREARRAKKTNGSASPASKL